MNPGVRRYGPCSTRRYARATSSPCCLAFAAGAVTTVLGMVRPARVARRVLAGPVGRRDQRAPAGRVLDVPVMGPRREGEAGGGAAGQRLGQAVRGPDGRRQVRD